MCMLCENICEWVEGRSEGGDLHAVVGTHATFVVLGAQTEHEMSMCDLKLRFCISHLKAPDCRCFVRCSSLLPDLT